MSTAPRQVFTFDGYTVRPIGEQDRGYLEFLIASDPYHAGKMDADFFLKLHPGEDAWVLEDETGQIVLYFRTSTAVRLAVQFRPTETPADRQRNRRALLRGMRWIEDIFRKNLFREVIFDTEGPELQSFAQRHLGFVGAALMSKRLPSTFTPPKMAPESLGTVPNEAERVG